MPITEYINGVECVFPNSSEESLVHFKSMVIEALYEEVIAGRISEEDLNNAILEGEKNAKNSKDGN